MDSAQRGGGSGGPEPSSFNSIEWILAPFNYIYKCRKMWFLSIPLNGFTASTMKTSECMNSSFNSIEWIHHM